MERRKLLTLVDMSETDGGNDLENVDNMAELFYQELERFDGLDLHRLQVVHAEPIGKLWHSLYCTLTSGQVEKAVKNAELTHKDWMDLCDFMRELREKV